MANIHNGLMETSVVDPSFVDLFGNRDMVGSAQLTNTLDTWYNRLFNPFKLYSVDVAKGVDGNSYLVVELDEKGSKIINWGKVGLMALTVGVIILIFVMFRKARKRNKRRRR